MTLTRHVWNDLSIYSSDRTDNLVVIMGYSVAGM